MNIIDTMDFESGRRDYLALSVCMGYPNGGEKLIHFNDADRREQFDEAIGIGAIVVGVFWIMWCPKFGYTAGAKPFVKDPMWERVFERELKIMRDLISADPAFRMVIAERNPVIH